MQNENPTNTSISTRCGISLMIFLTSSDLGKQNWDRKDFKVIHHGLEKVKQGFSLKSGLRYPDQCSLGSKFGIAVR